MSKNKIKLKKSDLNHILRFFSFSKSPLRSIISVLFLGACMGVAYEETIGIGTWHIFHPKTDVINICFTPGIGACGNLIAQEIASAKKNIFVQAYGLTLPPVIYQLKAAQSRGIKVFVLLDGGNLSDNKSVYQELKSAGIDVAFDKMSGGIAHNKVMIIDNHKVITGSFNFTKGADTKNAENLLLIDDTNIAALYLQNWKARKQPNAFLPKIC